MEPPTTALSPAADGFVPPWAEWDFNEWETCTDTEMLGVGRHVSLQLLVYFAASNEYFGAACVSSCYGVCGIMTALMPTFSTDMLLWDCTLRRSTCQTHALTFAFAICTRRPNVKSKPVGRRDQA